MGLCPRERCRGQCPGGHGHHDHAGGALNQWSHVFHRTVTNTAAVLYINGIAAGLTETDYNLGLVFTTPANHQVIAFGNGKDGRGVDVNYFTGTLDDFTIGVAGQNRGIGVPGGADYGIIDLRVDNSYIAWQDGGFDRADVNMNGAVNQQDIDIFVANWRRNFTPFAAPHPTASNRLVGDFNSRKLGDLNYNGTVNLADAFILHNNIAPGSGLSFSLSALGVPEPTSAALLIGGVAILGWRRRVW